MLLPNCTLPISLTVTRAALTRCMNTTLKYYQYEITVLTPPSLVLTAGTNPKMACINVRKRKPWAKTGNFAKNDKHI